MIPARATAQNTATTRPNLRYAWYVVWALTAVYTLSFVDRQILSLLVGPIKRDLHISDTRIGLLQGLAFALFYTLMGLPLGRIADTSNRRNLMAAGVVVWSFFTGLCSLTKSFWSLFLARIGVGVGEASLSPAVYSMISDYFPEGRLGVALSVYYMGVFFGSSIAYLVGGTIVDVLGRTPIVVVPLLGAISSWRVTFLVVGAPGLLFALLLYSVREPIRRHLLLTADGRPVKVSFRDSLTQMGRRWKSVSGLSIGMVCQSMVTYGLTAWIPTYFQRVHGWTPGQSGRALGLILMTFGCLGMYVGGRLSDRLQRKGVSEGPLKVAVLSAIGTAVLLPLAMLMPRPEWSLALMAPGIFFDALPMGTSVAALQHIFPNQVRGQVSALYLFILNLGGLSLGPLLPGLFNDYLFHDEKMIGPSVALTVGGAAVLMLIIFRMTYRAYRSDYEMTHAVAGAT